MTNHCEDCGLEFGTELPKTRHHLHYRHEDADWEPEETVDLCWDCHKARHRDPNGDFWRDCEEMEAYWDTFYKEMEAG